MPEIIWYQNPAVCVIFMVTMFVLNAFFVFKERNFLSLLSFTISFFALLVSFGALVGMVGSVEKALGLLDIYFKIFLNS